MTQPDSAMAHEIVFDLAAVDSELRKEDAYQREGHTARTLVREPDLRIVLVVMKAGARIAEHRADQTASVQALMPSTRTGKDSAPSAADNALTIGASGETSLGCCASSRTTSARKSGCRVRTRAQIASISPRTASVNSPGSVRRSIFKEQRSG